MKNTYRNLIVAGAFLLATLVIGLANASANGTGTNTKQVLAKPNPEPPNTRKPVRVFILMGQSNMIGMGDIGPETNVGTLTYLCKKPGKYPYLLDDAGNWAVRNDVWCVKTTVRPAQGWLKPGFGASGKTFGPELGFGWVMGQIHDEQVLLIKASQGNRSLGWDFLPPGSERFSFDGKTYAGYKDAAPFWPEGTAPPPAKPNAWYAGKQYDDCVKDVHEVLDHLPNFFPDYRGQGYEVAGFVWWQGQKDQLRGADANASRYEHNLVNFINVLRKEFSAPHAPFVLATIGFGGWKMEGNTLKVANAQLAVGDPRKHPEFAGNVKTVDARAFWRGPEVSPNKKQDYHYYHNAETYLEVGNALGWAMADLLKAGK
ncbi:MAG TPA: sialate O-acetylesterase [bacterium]|nr:sialate O-acetylesterase [bacterium]